MKNSVCIILLGLVALPAASRAQQPTADLDTPLLTLEEAVSLALHDNRVLKNSVLEAEKHEFRVSAARTHRLPKFHVDVLTGELLHGIDYTFPAGAFGNYAGIGPIPSTEAKVHSPAKLTTFATGAVDLPLVHQYKIGLGIRATELGRDIALEGVRGERQKIAAEVRTAYLKLVATQAAVDAARQGVQTLEEAQRVSAQYELQKAVLRADVLDVDARLEKSRYELSVAQNGLATQREHLNKLLGRDLATSFRVHGMPEDEAAGLTLTAARQQAAANRPEIRQARLKEQQAEYDRRLAKAEYVPDVSLSVRYMGFNNFEVIPTSVATAGVFLTWEPFDWGRRGHNLAEKAKTIEQARNGAQETESQIAVEVGMKYRKCQEAAQQLKAARTGHAAALEQFRVTSNRFKQQAALIRDLLQAQARSAEAAFQHQEALSSYWSAVADLRRAMGEE